MSKTRLEAFSDGVLAIIITIMVLELKPPHDTSWLSIQQVLPTFLSYVISFIIIGVYWGNHHHLLHTAPHINSSVMWANLNLLFWLSLIPFTTKWMGEDNFQGLTVSIYAGHQIIAGMSFYILLLTIERTIPKDSPLLSILQKMAKKGLGTFVLYGISFIIALYYPPIALAIFGLVAIIWWIPDRNIEKTVKE